MSDINHVGHNREEHKREFANRTEKIAWYLDEIDCYKEDMGKWYTLLIRRILPFLVFALPINIVAEYTYKFVATRFLAGVLPVDNVALIIVAWLVSLLIFLVFLIFTPRFATFLEFAISGAYFGIAVITLIRFNQGLLPKPLVSSGLGYSVTIALAIFMFMKLVFLVLEIMYLIIFRGEREPRAYKNDANDDMVF